MQDPPEQRPTTSGNVYGDHRRTFEDNRHVYAVVSRRSQGVSIGINLNPDRVCNFDCVYCQVDRTTEASPGGVEVPQVIEELEDMLDRVQSGELFEAECFRDIPPALRRLNDIAFSGDGEPTTCPAFPQVVQAVADIRRRRGLDAVKLVLITNASRLHHPSVREALAVLDANNGEVWAKLDAGTEAYFHLVNRTSVPFQRILGNLADTARVRPLVIQALFMKLHGEPPLTEELEAFCGRLNDISRSGGKIRLVQVYTVSRAPAEPWVEPLSAAEVSAIADRVRRGTGLPVEAYSSVGLAAAVRSPA
jgi:wyosine [tRNA(Phe)-imidazoG37] synthetase (radical SAM superfamily)